MLYDPEELFVLQKQLEKNTSGSTPPGHLVKIRRIKRYDISVLDESPSEQLRRESKRLLETAGKVIEHPDGAGG